MLHTVSECNALDADDKELHFSHTVRETEAGESFIRNADCYSVA